MTCLVSLLLAAAIVSDNDSLRLPETSELTLSTVRIESYTGRSRLGIATGFFFAPDAERLFLITNRHVVRNEKEVFYPDHLQLRLHSDAADLRESLEYAVKLYNDTEQKQQRWRELSKDVDVVALPLDRADLLKRFVIKVFQPENLVTDDIVLGIGDPVIVIGYPLGFSDDTFNLPLVRQGAVASVYPMPFKGNPYFLIDANLHPGMSGSPVVTKPSAMQMTKTGPRIGGPLFYLVGVHSGGFGLLNLNTVWFADIISQVVP